jgi:hypothetical protein
MIVEVLGKNEEESFRKFVEKIPCCSAQNSLDWRDFICDLGQDQPYFIIAKQNNEIIGFLPLYFFKGKYGDILTSNAWSTISGIICSPEISDKKQIYSILLDYSISLANELDCSLISIGTNPFLNDSILYSGIEPDYVLENFIQYISINEIFSPDGSFIHPNYLKRTNLSRNLDKLNQIQIIISDEQSSKNLDQALILQEKRMRELGANSYPKNFFESALKNIALRGKGKFLFAFYNQKMIATCLFLANHNTIDVYMLCMDSDFKHLRPNFAIAKYLLNWAYNNKIPLLNWMSSPSRDRGVYNWKEQWGSKEHTFRYLTKVTGDISSWRKLTLSELANAYRFHYLLPFNLLNATCCNFTTKDELSTFFHSTSSQIGKKSG